MATRTAQGQGSHIEIRENRWLVRQRTTGQEPLQASVDAPSRDIVIRSTHLSKLEQILEYLKALHK